MQDSRKLTRFLVAFAKLSIENCENDELGDFVDGGDMHRQTTNRLYCGGQIWALIDSTPIITSAALVATLGWRAAEDDITCLQTIEFNYLLQLNAAK